MPQLIQQKIQQQIQQEEKEVQKKGGVKTEGVGKDVDLRGVLYDSMMEVDRLWILLQQKRENTSNLYDLKKTPNKNSDTNNNDNNDDGDDGEDGGDEIVDDPLGEYDSSGCTCCAMLISPLGQLLVGNIGDTRAVLCRDGYVCKSDAGAL